MLLEHLWSASHHLAGLSVTSAASGFQQSKSEFLMNMAVYGRFVVSVAN
jgi:hypothetical protein